MLLARGRAITDEAWCGSPTARPRLYHPKDVAAGTTALVDQHALARWELVNYAVRGKTVAPNSTTYGAETIGAAVARAPYWLNRGWA